MLFSDQLDEHIKSAVGQYDILKAHRGDSERTGVFKIFSEGKWYFVKIHNRLSHWNPEVYAYKHWTPPIEPFAPTLVASFNENDLFGIIISPIAGMTVNERQIKDDDKLSQIYFSAGQLYKKMQENKVGTYFGIPKADGNPYENDTKTDPVAYVSDSIEMIFKNGYNKGVIDNSAKPLIDWCLKNCDAFSDELPVPTNWDFSPQNWMVDENGDFTGFIDFENMLWGISLDSFGVVLERYTFNKPHLAESLFQGYGLANDEETQTKLKILKAKLAIADIYYGHSTNNSHFYECGKRMLLHMIDAHS